MMSHEYEEEWYGFSGDQKASRGMPATRAAIMSNAGQIDGEAGRIDGFNAIYTNLIRVDEPTHADTVLAFATGSDDCA